MSSGHNGRRATKVGIEVLNAGLRAHHAASDYTHFH